MKKPNMELRVYAKVKGIPLWMIAKKLNFSDGKLYALLRVESKEFTDAFRKAVDELSKE